MLTLFFQKSYQLQFQAQWQLQQHNFAEEHATNGEKEENDFVER